MKPTVAFLFVLAAANAILGVWTFVDGPSLYTRCLEAGAFTPSHWYFAAKWAPGLLAVALMTVALARRERSLQRLALHANALVMVLVSVNVWRAVFGGWVPMRAMCRVEEAWSQVIGFSVLGAAYVWEFILRDRRERTT